MQYKGTDAGGVLTCGPVEEGSEIDWIDGRNDLSDECFLCCLTELERLFAFFPDILGAIDLCGGALQWRDEDAWITRCCPGDGVIEGGVADVREEKSEMTVEPPPKVEGTELAFAFNSVRRF